MTTLSIRLGRPITVCALIIATLIVPRGNTLQLQAAGTNLIANNSLETIGTNGLPNSWNSTKWGTNSPTFTVENTGQDGTKSVKVSMTGYSNGDARWNFADVAVTPNTNYTFTAYYQANVTGEVDLDTTTTSNTHTYTYLGATSVSSTWKQATFTFTTTSNATKATVFFPLFQNGFIQTDNYFLGTTQTPPPPTTTNLIKNPSFETLTNNQPTSWIKNSYGSNTAAFAIDSSSAQDGTKSAKVTISNYVDGEADWVFNPVTVKPNTTYTFSFYYKSNIEGEVDIDTTDISGNHSYDYLDNTPATNNWSFKNITFKTSATAKTVSIYLPLVANGFIQTDNYTLQEKPIVVPFSRALVSVEFDDGWKDAYTTGFPIVESFGFKATDNIISGLVNTTDYVVSADVINLKSRGHKLGSHTVSHSHLPTLTTSQISTELAQSKQYLDTLLGTSTNTLATPYCESNVDVIAKAKTLYASLRNCEATTNSKPTFDRYNLRSVIVENSTPNSVIQDLLNQAIAEKSWLILVYHRVRPDVETYSVSSSTLTSQMQLVKNSGVTVKTSEDALNEVLAQ